LIGRLTVTLAIALLMLVLATMASADTISTPNYPLVIPDGSTVTSIFIPPSPGIGVTFTFPDGYGQAEEFAGNYLPNGEYAAGGTLGFFYFNVPVTNLSLTATLGNATFGELQVSPVAFFVCTSACPGLFDLTITNAPVEVISWDAVYGGAGIESMSHTLDPAACAVPFTCTGPTGVPEPRFY
jgi:hypothetical protein